MANIRLTFKSIYNDTKASIGYGKKCVVLTMDDSRGNHMGFIMTPEETRALARGLTKLAKSSEIYP